MERQTFPVVVTGTLTAPSGSSTKVTMAIHASGTKLVVEVLDSQEELSVAPGAVCRFVGHVVEGEPSIGELVTIDQLHLSRRRRSTRSWHGALFEPWDETVFGAPPAGTAATCVSLARSVATVLPEMRGVEIGSFVLTIEPRTPSYVEALLHGPSRHSDRFHSTIVLAGPLLAAERYEEMMKELATLLGIVLSHSPFTTQTIREYSDGTQSRHLRSDGGLGVGSSKTVEQSCHAECLQRAWCTWSSLDESFRQALRISSTYLAASCEGYLDTQLFSAFQAWEVLAKAYVKQFQDASDQQDRAEHTKALDELAVRLQGAHDDWAAEFPDEAVSPIENFVGLIESAKRIQTQSAVDYLIARTGLDIERVGLDVKRLRQATNKVRHTGMLPPKKEYASDFHAYQRAKFALELVILKILGYEGLIRYESNSTWWTDPIDHFFGGK